MAHRRASSGKSGEELRGFWDRHEWLASAAEGHIKQLAQTPATVDRDPMLFFNHMLAHSAVICLGETIQRTPWQAAEYQLRDGTYEQRVSRVIYKMVLLVKMLPSFNCFKAHPFLPNLLAFALTSLLSGNPTNDSQAGVETMLRLLKSLREANRLASKIYSLYDGSRYSLLQVQ